MIVGVIGSGAIGPDLAYGFVSALARDPGARVYLHDIKPEALEAGVARIRGYVKKGLIRGKLSARLAAAIDGALTPTLELSDLADCDYVLEAATEQLPIKRVILRNLEAVVGPDCLIGFATSGIPRAQIAVEAAHPERCFVNHPFYPAWRALPIEVVLSGDEALGERMVRTLERLGKVPVVTADVACFAADDIFCNYCSEAARLAAEGIATPAQVDRIVNDAIGGGGPFNVLDLTRGNLLTAHCQELMAEAPTGTPWFDPPAILTERGNALWHDRKAPGDPTHDEATGKLVLDRILAVLIARTVFVVEEGICSATETNWLTRTALGFRRGLLEVARDLGPQRVLALCTAYKAEHPDFPIPTWIAEERPIELRRSVLVERRERVGVVTVYRPEVKNALDRETLAEIGEAIEQLRGDDAIDGVVLTGWGGALAGADVMELANLDSREAGEAICRRGQAIIDRIPAGDKPVVAALDGPALGGGAELSMACHARVAGPQLVMGQPEVKLGIVPGYGGTQRLPRLIGLEAAARILRLGGQMSAQQAVDAGWAVPAGDDSAVDSAVALVRRHAAGELALEPVDPAPMDVSGGLPALDIGQASRTIDAILVRTLVEGLAQPLSEGLQTEITAVGACTQTIDFDIGMKNFLQNGPRVPALFLHE